MKDKIHSLPTTIFVLTLFLLTCFVSCDKTSPPTEPEVELPPMNDEIPYDILGEGKIVLERVGPYPGEYNGCYVINIDQKKSYPIDVGTFLASGFCVSPDGKKIAFTKFTDYISYYDTYLMDIDGSNIQKVETLEDQSRYPSWTPDGKKLLFWVDRVPPSLYVTSSNDPKNNVSEIRAFWDTPAPSGRFTVSKDGKIAFVTQGHAENPNASGLFTMNFDGMNRKLIVQLPSDRFFESPQFSPDGQKIAYMSIALNQSHEYKQLDIYEIHVTGQNKRLIKSFTVSGKEWAVNGKLLGVSLAWSPDGSKILFNLPEGDFVSHLYIINEDGTGLTQITNAEGVTDRCVSWSN